MIRLRALLLISSVLLLGVAFICTFHGCASSPGPEHGLKYFGNENAPERPGSESGFGVKEDNRASFGQVKPPSAGVSGNLPALVPVGAGSGANPSNHNGDGSSFSGTWFDSGSIPSRVVNNAEVIATLPIAVPGSVPSEAEEIWVIQRFVPAKANAQPADNQAPVEPGTGALMARTADQRLVPVPLKHTDVHASISAYIASVDVTQQFENPYSEKIEAVYVFPLPHDAAINEFVMTIGERHIRGLIRDRAEAQQIYNQAKEQGYVASLLTQERPNIFTQSVANIEPGKQIDIAIKYYNTLAYVDGAYEFVFPMVVGPPHASGQATEVHYLNPAQRSGHDISVTIDLDAGVAVEQLSCATHHLVIKSHTASTATITLDPADSIPNKDLVLRYQVAGKHTKSAILTQRDPKDANSGYFTLVLYPPEDLTSLPRKPLEMVFTVDVSGSQSGEPLKQEKAAVRYALTHMDANDTFQVIRFGNTAIRRYAAPVAANAENVKDALGWVEGFDANEGTMLVDGLRASLNFPHDPARLRFVTFLTDGFIGNEAEALTEIKKDLGASRIFTFGVGSSTNRYLLDHMAKLGSGAVAYLNLKDDADTVMAQFFSRISHPALTDISLDFGSLKVSGVYPSRIPDLFAGRPVVVTGRYTGSGEATIHIKGSVGRETRDIPLTVNVSDPANVHAGLAAIWARHKIAELYDSAVTSTNAAAELVPAIKSTALSYGLMSPYTAFLAVDSLARTEGGHGTTVAVPVPVPEGVRYETTVGGGGH